MNDRRLDIEIARRGLAPSRSKARALIEEGAVRLNGRPAQKCAELCGEGDVIEIDGGMEFVGRGGLKLEHALTCFAIDARGVTAIDIGASTGGFVHCLLKAGAERVFAVDVGSDQLAQALRLDSRVVSMEGTDVRELTREMFCSPAELIVCDVSFISLRLVLPKIHELMAQDGQAVVLVKPQFEAGRERIGKNGIVKDKKVHAAVLCELLEYVKLLGFTCVDIIASPIKGGSGNIEFFLHLSFSVNQWPGDIRAFVRQAHEQLNGI